ncbi:Putative multidrug export ATP-binding/permease protein [Bhargavaea cecembensis DSE10]|uniref:Putative multidrug export ATP-binding/permease protein n=1 Tax=Bhargavaea cecembensis DSE10 TaxID=1235279 RepID=M7NE96_9BACL|nr:ABC transporter ATP-binding protein [Bhargavaea cecembensis]EMR06873.1 Putative multidrug export ATP-binding/permease protein [Bhargavaea cecembensis DSE10]
MEKRTQRTKRTFRERLSFQEFGKLWNVENTGGHLISKSPPVPVREIFRRFWPYVRSYHIWIIVSLLLIALQPMVQSATVWLMQVFIDQVLIAEDFSPIKWVITAYLGLAVLRGVLYFSGTYLSNWVGQNFILNLRKSLFEHLQGLSLSFFEGRKLGDILSRLSSDISSIERLIITGLTSAVSYIFQLLVFIGMLFYMQWKLALVSLIVVPLFYAVTRFFSSRIKLASRERTRREGAINSISEESFSNIALMQAYNQQSAESERFGVQNLRSFEAKMLKVRLKAAFTPVVSLIETGGTVVVMGAGAWLLVNNEITVGALVAFIMLLGKLYSPVRSLSKLLNTIFSASASAERVIEFMEEQPQVKESPYELEQAEGRIEFKNVSFTYPGKSKPVLSDVSFTVSPGESVALVGASGAGKSTIVKLLMRFYDPSSGTVLLDGFALKGLKVDSLRENVAVLFQESLIFDGTVRENIAYGKPDATDEEIVQAAKAADAHGFIMKLADGYDTPVGQKGRNLSGGQRQRLAIARAMIRNAPILILDEPAEGLDANSEMLIAEPMNRLMKDRATLMITHNLRSAAKADRILYLKDGEVVESGSHEELLKRGGPYSELYQVQQGAKKPLAAVPASNVVNLE